MCSINGNRNLISKFCIFCRQICTLELCLSRFVWDGISTSPLCSCWSSLPSTLLQVCMCTYVFCRYTVQNLGSVSFINVFDVYMLTSPALFRSEQTKLYFCKILLQFKISFLFYYILKCTLFL